MSDPRVDRPHLIWWILVLGGMTTLAVLAFHAGAYAWWTQHLFWLPPSVVLIAVFVVAVGLHVGEALYSRGLARRLGLAASAPAWTLQTLLLGYPSLRLLLRHAPKG